MYSFRCNRCKNGFISSMKIEEPICGKCIQFIKSLDYTINNEKICSSCGKEGVLYSKEKCPECYFRS